MRKSYFISIIAISMVLGITGCGNNTAAVATEAPAETIEYQGEGAVQGGIKSEDELAALEAEGEQYEQYAEPEATEEATPEVAETSTGSWNSEYVSASNFWEGSDYFDIVAFAKANGCCQIAYYGPNGKTDDESIATAYKFYFYDGTWCIAPTTAGGTLTYLGETDADGFCTGSPQYMYLVKDINDNQFVSVNKNMADAVLTAQAIDALDAVVRELNRNHDSLDPLTNLEYTYSRAK